jgi:hypothetical protein
VAAGDRECRCHLLTRVVAGGAEFKGLRCPACIDAVLESKNEVVRENDRLRAELEAARGGRVAG